MKWQVSLFFAIVLCPALECSLLADNVLRAAEYVTLCLDTSRYVINEALIHLLLRGHCRIIFDRRILNVPDYCYNPRVMNVVVDEVCRLLQPPRR